MSDSKLPFYTAAQVRELDRIAIEDKGIPGIVLMFAAGQACFNVLQSQWPEATDVLVFCGTGNNGGDGFVIAALCQQAALNVKVKLVGELASIKGTAKQALKYAMDHGVQIESADSEFLHQDSSYQEHNTVLVDALLGTGLQGEVREVYARHIRAINDSGLPVLSVDIPSGLCSDTGKVLGVAVHATVTVTFIGRKLGLVKGLGPDYCGVCIFDDLSVPKDVYRQVKPTLISTL